MRGGGWNIGALESGLIKRVVQHVVGIDLRLGHAGWERIKLQKWIYKTSIILTLICRVVVRLGTKDKKWN